MSKRFPWWLRRYVWELEEIEELPSFGMKSGWFYGLVRNHETGRVRLYEIFPGLGYAETGAYMLFHWPKTWLWIVTDIRRTPRRKEMHGIRDRRGLGTE